MGKHLFDLPQRQSDALRRLSEQTELAQVEIVRRLIDRALRPECLNELVPSMSGALRVG